MPTSPRLSVNVFLLLCEHTLGVQERLIVDRTFLVLFRCNLNGAPAAVVLTVSDTTRSCSRKKETMPFSTSSLAQHRVAVGQHGLLESRILRPHVVLDASVVQKIPIEARTYLTN